MNIELKKSGFIHWINSIKDEKIINRINTIKETQNADWWNELPPHEKESIDKGISDIEKGKIYQHSEAKKLYGQMKHILICN